MVDKNERRRINREIADLLGYKIIWPNWSGNLDMAWELHKLRPDGTTLFALDWLELSSEDAAYEICKSFVYWTRAIRAKIPPLHILCLVCNEAYPNYLEICPQCLK